MFKKLTEFSYKRTALEAVGFYLAWLVLLLLTGALAGVFIGSAVPPEKALSYSLIAGQTLAFVMCPTLSGLILAQKKLYSFGYILLVILTGFVALLGAVCGLIPAAFLTTRKSAQKPGKK